MVQSIEYQGHMITSATRRRTKKLAWTLEVHIMPLGGRRTGIRRCRAPNTYSSEAEAASRCLEFGRRIVDGKLHPRAKGTRLN